MKTKKPPFRAFDSDLGVEYPEHRRFSVAYEPIWQSIRVQLRWVELDQAGASLARCEAYIISGPADDMSRRIWRVYNLLCAIPHGQSTNIGIRFITRPATAMLTEQMELYRQRLYDIGYPTTWDWAEARKNAIAMQERAPEMFKETVDHLLRYRSSRADAKPELRHYLRICLDAMGIYEPLEHKHR